MPVGLVSPSVIQYNSLDFVRSGWVDLAYNSLKYVGRNGYSWSNIASDYHLSSYDTAYELSFNLSGVNSSDNSKHRSYGFPVRCLVY